MGSDVLGGAISAMEEELGLTDTKAEEKKMTAEGHYWQIHDEIKELHKRKGADYGTDEDPFDNLRASEDFGLAAWIGVAIRMRDKQSRIQSFIKKGVLANESIEDSFLDLANYAMLALALYREAKDDDRTDEGP